MGVSRAGGAGGDAIGAGAGAGVELPTAKELGFVPSRRVRRAEARLSEKVYCLWRAAQSGKTRKIMEMIRSTPELAAGFHIVICANIRLQVEQLTSRMKRELFYLPDEDSDSDSVYSGGTEDDDDKIEGEVCTWLSGASAKKKMTKGELANEIKEERVSMVVCCSHKTRFKHLVSLLEDLEKSRLFNKQITVWIDEADASVKLWSTPELDLTRFTKVQRMNLVSATFNSVVHRFGRIRVMGYPDTHPETYMPLKECNLVVQPVYASPVDTLTAVLEKHPEMCAPGARVFAPALVARATHDGVAEFLTSKGFAVMVLNGERKCIECPDGQVIPIVLNINGLDPDEIATVLPRLYEEYNLARWPFAVTGQMCLGRGITFQSSEFAFDFGVMPDLPDPASAYQCVARLLGNVKGYPDWKAPTVFTSVRMKNWMLAEEHVAIRIATEVASKGWADVGEEEIDTVLSGSVEGGVAVRRGGRRGGVWGVPIRVAIPVELVSSKLFHTTPPNYVAIAVALAPLLTAEQQEIIRGRSLVSCVKRGVPNWMATVERSCLARQSQCPNISGRVTPEVIASAKNSYWLDVAIRDVSPTITRGTAFITYGL